MVHEMIDGTYRQTNLPNESAEYLSKREELRLAEIELLRTATGLVLVGANRRRWGRNGHDVNRKQ